MSKILIVVYFKILLYLQTQRRMYKENYNAPTQDNYSPKSWQRQGSQTFSAIKKTSSAHKSTEIGSYSPYRSTTVSRLEDAKRTIDSVIGDLHDKRDMNDQAIRQIRSVHYQLADDLRKNFSVYGKKSASTFTPDYKSHQGSTYDLRAISPQDDNTDLRGKLNQEMRKNNDLMLRISRLQEENDYLKKDKQMTFGPMAQAIELQAENQRLKYSLSQVSQLPQQFYQELEELKRENQRLRTDTVKLLHKVDRII